LNLEDLERAAESGQVVGRTGRRGVGREEVW
jgi:hypothetical protein